MNILAVISIECVLCRPRRPAHTTNINNIQYNQCSINSLATVIHTIETVSVPRAIQMYRRSRKVSLRNLINIKLNHIECTASTFNLKLGLLNIRSLASKALIVNDIITDQKYILMCLTETWIKPNEYIALNEASPPGYSYVHQPRLTGRGGGVGLIHSENLVVTQKPKHEFNSFEILYTSVNYVATKNK
ncbi:hypothetical protein AMELA_G00179760 [Ameiurus melas]|uniref:Uncharacterized protein n=1 Tax=Ameiurus melas TaxID=219545 RepID=A0A7J6AC36_AMEME|nr:hypothetical protein AMELA_G00179760 [Ameiurus melas]